MAPTGCWSFNMRRAAVLILLMLVSPAVPAVAQTTLAGEPIAMTRSAGKITIDGDLDDEGWRNATRVDKWYETQPGDNTEPKVKNVGYLTYDDRFFYAAFEFEDPDPSSIKAPFADRDNIGNGYNDYGGVILDSRNSGRTATLFVVSPRNVQYRFGAGRCVGRGFGAGFLLGFGGADERSWLDARDPHPVHVVALSERRSTDVADPPVPKLPTRSPFSVLLGEVSARQQLFHLPIEFPDRSRALAGGRPPGRWRPT